MRITSKGQVTIPLAIRKKFGLLPNTEVEFVDDGYNVHIKKKMPAAGKGRGWKIVEHMRGRGTGKMTTDQIMALMRG